MFSCCNASEPNMSNFLYGMKSSLSGSETWNDSVNIIEKTLEKGLLAKAWQSEALAISVDILKQPI